MPLLFYKIDISKEGVGKKTKIGCLLIVGQEVWSSVHELIKSNTTPQLTFKLHVHISTLHVSNNCYIHVFIQTFPDIFFY